jgi:autotransporter-associated beta strand protein
MMLIVCGLLATSRPVLAAETILLGEAANLAILGGSTVTNTGATIVTGNLGLSPGSSVTGFPPGMVVNGAIHINDALATQAHADAFTAYNQLQNEPFNTNLTGMNLGGLTLTPGVYHFDTSAQLTGTLSLDTGGDPNAAFHFQIGTTLTTASNAGVLLLGLNGAPDPNIFWQVGSSATIGTGTTFAGTIIALASVTFAAGANLTDGRVLAINGAVTLDTNNINGSVAAIATGEVWNGGASNLWSGVNWSPDLTGATSSTLAPTADVIFSVTGIVSQNQNTTLDFDAAISSLTVNDPVAVTISGAHVLSILGGGTSTGIAINSSAGLTTIDSGLFLGAGSQGVAVNNAAGLFVNGVISGANGLIKSGSGQLVLNGVNSYTGQTTLIAGALEVNGSIVGDTLVSGGTLRGVGTIGGNVVNNSAVSPGHVGSVGTLNTGGNYLQNFAGALNIRLASPLSYDTLAMGGAATLSGALNVNYVGGFNAVPGEVFTIVTTANGVSGRFTSFNDAHATGTRFTLMVVYEPTDVLLQFGLAPFTSFVLDDHCHPNELAVARALDKLAANNPAHELIVELNALPVEQLPEAFSLLSPEQLTSIFTAGLAVSQVQMGNIEHRLADVRQGATGFSDSGFAVNDRRERHETREYDGKTMVDTSGKEVVTPLAVPDYRWGFFISGTGELVDVENTCGARGSSFVTDGATVGADYRVSSNFVLGAAIGYANISSDLNRDGHLDIDNGKGSLYGTFYTQGFYINGIAGGGFSSIDTRRATVGGFARGDTDGTEFNALLGIGHDFHIGAFSIGPVASIQYSTVGIDGFSEHGALGALRIDSQSQDSLKSAAGLRASYAKKMGGVVLIPEVRAQWGHEYLTSTPSINAGFTSDDSFTVHGPHIGHDSLLLDAGASAQLTPRVAIFGFYGGELFRENYTAHSINGGVRVTF